METAETFFLEVIFEQRPGKRATLLRAILFGLSQVFEIIVKLRRFLYNVRILRDSTLGIQVIAVGNLTVGGTGKTPVVLAITRLLGQSGWRCGIISRGYSRRVANNELRKRATAVIHVVPISSEPVLVGDEALLLAQRSGVPVYVSADRAAAARSLLQHHPEVDVLICDDGLQHYALHRDLEICVIDGARGLGNGALLPAGALREPVRRLTDVDAIVINRTVSAGQLNRGPAIRDVRIYSMTLGNESLMRVSDDQVMSIEQGLAGFSTKRMLAIAGIGNPARFFAHVSSLGFKPAESRAFPDHHPFAATDFSRYDAGIILMTEKDAVKCKAFADDRMWFMRVDAILPEAFGEFILKRLSELGK